MDTEILIALIGRMIDERLTGLPHNSGHRGPRGFPGRDGRDGKDFSFTEHEGTIREWAKEFALSFEDLSNDQIESLRGPRGRDGTRGLDGHSFVYGEHKNEIESIIRAELLLLRESMRLRYADLSDEERAELRGPRGRDGRDGRDFNFDEHRDFFEGLKLKFSDLTDAEKDSLKLQFSQLTEEEKASLKLRFEDLTADDRILLRGPRGLRGQRGSHGRDGKDGLSIRGLPGPQGLRGIDGRSGIDGRDGLNGADSPYVVDIQIEEYGDQIYFVFYLSDGNSIQTSRVDLPKPVIVQQFSGGSSSGGGRKMDLETIVDEANSTTTYVGYAKLGYANTTQANWKIKRITISGSETIIQYADSNAEFDNVWDNRASLVYG